MEIQSMSPSSLVGGPSDKKGVGSDFETFLRMLTTQLQNQDPLNPIDSADYAVQLATFSGVEQAVRTNELLVSLGRQFGVLSMTQLAGWVGQEARVAAPVFFEGAPVDLALPQSTSADRAVLVVRDASGVLVAREEVPTSGGDYQWMGRDAAGDPLPGGIYTLLIEAYRGDVLQTSAAVESYATIAEARGSATGTSLVLRGGITVAAENVTALRIPS